MIVGGVYIAGINWVIFILNELYFDAYRQGHVFYTMVQRSVFNYCVVFFLNHGNRM